MDRIDQPAVQADQGPDSSPASSALCCCCGMPLYLVSCDACHGNGWVLELRREFVKATRLRPGQYETRIIQRGCALCGGSGQRAAGS